MQFTYIMAVLATLVISSNCPDGPVTGAGLRLLIASVGMGLVTAFAAVSSGHIASGLRRDFDRRCDLLRRFQRLRSIHVILWLVITGLILFWLDWAQLVRFNWQLDRAFLVDDILILLPVLLPMVLSWAAFYEVDHALRVEFDGETALETQLSTRWRYVQMQARHYMGILLFPVLGLLAFQDAAELLWPDVLDGPYAAFVYLPPFTLMFCLFPVMLRYIWETWPLPEGPIREQLETVARQAGFRVREILVWHTGGMVVNAAVAGFIPRLRYVYLTDGLLSQLKPLEIAAVFGHEVGHVRHHHLSLRMLAMLVPVSLFFLVEQFMPGISSRLETWATEGPILGQLPIELPLLMAMGVYVLVVFGAYSRLLEGQADLHGCTAARMIDDAEEGPVESFISALEKLAVVNGTNRRMPGWQHASVARRVDFLRRVATNPNRERRFHRRVRLVNLLLIGLVFSPVLLGLFLG